MAPTEPLRMVVRPTLPVDLGLTVRVLRHGRGDPTMLADGAGAWWRATWTPDGPATVRLVQAGDGVEAQAWGPGAAAALDAVPGLVGVHDTLDGFAPVGLVRDAHRRLRGMRVVRTGAIFETLAPTVLEQRVMLIEAFAAWRAIVKAWGVPAPGPLPSLRLPPRPADLVAKPAWAFHPLGVEQGRANTIRVAASYARRVEAAAALPPAEARRLLEALPGVGPWTSARVTEVALGDADAVPLGDLHLPHMVSWSLAGEPRGSDERMLELLAPYEGHRARVLRLLAFTGSWAPRRGPRLPLRRLASF
jgi:3-methyladenine DNA glycosylase/8-oxoguanine DNA glycosylase